ncbi:MAG: HDIG domain-containing protein [bacterium]|nr:HDIG domain-containing protein [bacterium]MDT8396485.1 HDIG domain-containing protein [bacterium]
MTDKTKPAGTDQTGWRSFVKWNQDTQTSILFWVTVILVTYLLVPAKPFRAADYKAGDIAQRDIRATRSFLVEDPSSTRARKLEAEASVLAVFDLDPTQASKILASLRGFFSRMRTMIELQKEEESGLIQEVRAGGKAEKAVLQQELDLFRQGAQTERSAAIAAFIDQLSVNLDPDEMKPLLEDGFSERTEKVIVDAFTPILSQSIVDNRETLLRERGKGITVRSIDRPTEEVVLDDFSGILSVEAARTQVRKGITSVTWSKQALPLRRLLEKMVDDLVRPSMTYGRSETEERRKKAVGDTSAVYYQVRRGEVIVRAGDPLTEEQILKISELKELSPDMSRTSFILGLFLLISIVTYACFMLLRVVHPQTAGDVRGLSILAVVIVLQVATMRGVLLLSEAVTTTYTGLSQTTLHLVIPFALGAMVSGTLFPVTVSIVTAALLSIFSAVFLEWSHIIFLYSFLGGIVAAFSVVHCRQRFSLIRAGLAVSAANMGIALVILLLEGELFAANPASQLLSAAGGGILVALIASLAIPILESTFNVASDMKLMELANLNQPALKEMILKAPGSYHHSVLVGSLAEGAAEEIGANPLLARVAATYHDIGKMNKPEYFVENQENRDNRHEKLSPSMSALILASHVKEGAEVAREHRLPRRVVDIITQHHGTRIIKFFYNKAKEMEDPSVQTVDERDFRYPGPKPQSREAALIMLADAVEAASKVLTDPTPARIRGLIQKIINDIFIDGQLDESNLTLRELHQIARSFTRTVTGILHHRIDYPEPQGITEERKREKKRKDDPVSESETGDGGTPEEPDGAGVKNIKRLGQE